MRAGVGAQLARDRVCLRRGLLRVREELSVAPLVSRAERVGGPTGRPHGTSVEVEHPLRLGLGARGRAQLAHGFEPGIDFPHSRRDELGKLVRRLDLSRRVEGPERALEVAAERGRLSGPAARILAARPTARTAEQRKNECERKGDETAHGAKRTHRKR